MAASFKTLARIQARVSRALDELEDDDKVAVLKAEIESVESGAKIEDDDNNKP